MKDHEIATYIVYKFTPRVHCQHPALRETTVNWANDTSTASQWH